ncbi:MAG: alcohol dehydrogenase catalytic domain-containing protein [Myxococcales bacterium]|nr:alcohol dehydrogenase catalytic domain-containing protein [Myxococcales bacterium]
MRAAIWNEPGKPLVIGEVPDPSPGPRELVLRVHGCGICGSDLHVSDTTSFPPGTVMGHEFAGEVVAIGPDANAAVDGREWQLGDRVASLPAVGCARCAPCLTGDVMVCPDLQTTGLGVLPGGYAEYVRVGARESLRLPDNASFAEGALVEPLAVGLHVVDVARIAARENVLIIGAGPVGAAVAVWARHSGARSVILSDPVAPRRDLACRLGASGAIDPTSQEVLPEFERQAGAPPDVIVECVGIPGMIQHCIEVAPTRSRVIIAGVCLQPDNIVPVLGVMKELSLKFVAYYHRSDFETTIDALANERLPTREMITDRVALDAMPDAFEALKQPTTQCKVVVEP